MATRRRIFGVIDGLKVLRLTFGVIGNDEFDWVEYPRYSRRNAVKIFAYSVLEEGNIDHTIVLGIPDAIDKIANRLRSITTATVATYRRHTRVVPPCNEPLFYEGKELALTHHRMG